MFVVDASVWVARFRPPDVNHAASYEWLSRVFNEGMHVVGPTLLLPETAGPIARAASELDARRALAELMRLLALRVIPFGHDLARLSAQFAARFKMRGADSVYVALAYDLRMPLVTWDDEQRTRASTVVTVRTPGEMMAEL